MASSSEASSVPTVYELVNPTLSAIRALGGSASIAEIVNRVIEDMNLSPQVVQAPHTDETHRTRLEYNLAWSRTFLKGHGLINNSRRGVWSLTALGRDTERVETQGTRSTSPRQRTGETREGRDAVGVTEESSDAVAHMGGEPPVDETVLIEESSDEFASWRETLSAALLSMTPDAFERLCQRLLRESGFIEVHVTGRSGDGGIDGRGIIRLAGMISFPVVFQCKRYTNNVAAGTVRDFRGAMAGRADRGLILTTGGFTGDAQKEATRDGVPPIDLIDGELLMDRLKELELGVSVRTVEVVEVDRGFFDSI